MKSYLSVLFLFTVTLVFIFSCKTRTDHEADPVITYSLNHSDSCINNIEEGKHEIFYGILTPVEISSIFERLGSSYTPEILNSDQNSNSYLSSSKAALNLGVYGVDLSYMKMFGMNQEMINYMVVVRSLSKKLDIPVDYLTEPVEQLESNMDDPDSIMTMVNIAYKRIEDHLGESGRESTAGLMVLGGWIEALYIASEMLLDTNKPDPEIIARIAEQKYTLNTLLSFLKNYYDDPVVVYYSKKLKFLKKYFDRFEIYFDKEDLEIDRSKQVLKASKTEMTITRQNLSDISDYVKKLREETVSF